MRMKSIVNFEGKDACKLISSLCAVNPLNSRVTLFGLAPSTFTEDKQAFAQAFLLRPSFRGWNVRVAQKLQCKHQCGLGKQMGRCQAVSNLRVAGDGCKNLRFAMFLLRQSATPKPFDFLCQSKLSFHQHCESVRSNRSRFLHFGCSH